ncbi:hypothetical protein GIB67_032201 [Kingdonia uniflora]|uniref:No apical meristem-associated C-terminal domain-containing protein n=1 Tax=Kingdonia uniflora TaxID=39325 RepID=A0A7J7MXC1_9MAGN|nr:hypothetical protein GIB67_032201 [Kingdonia uniflora]
MGIQNKDLMKFWIHVSEDIIKSNNQQLDIFWNSVLDVFHDFCEQDGERVKRKVSSLKNYWSDMNRACKAYGTCLKNAMQGPISGMRQVNLKKEEYIVKRDKKKEECIVERDKKKEEYITDRDKKKEDRNDRIIELREKKTKAVVNLEVQFQAQNDREVTAMDFSTLDDTQRVYWGAQRNAAMARMFKANNNA